MRFLLDTNVVIALEPTAPDAVGRAHSSLDTVVLRYQMGPKASDVMRQARELSDDERRELAIELLDSAVAPEVRAAWIDEVRKRVHDVDCGPVVTLSNEEALQLTAADD